MHQKRNASTAFGGRDHGDVVGNRVVVEEVSGTVRVSRPTRAHVQRTAKDDDAFATFNAAAIAYTNPVFKEFFAPWQHGV